MSARGFIIAAHVTYRGLDMVRVDLERPTLRAARELIDNWFGWGRSREVIDGATLRGNEWTITSKRTGRVYRGLVFTVVASSTPAVTLPPADSYHSMPLKP